MDEDIDDRVSLFELKNYIKMSGVPIPAGVADEMFTDATIYRPIVHNA